MLSNVRLFGDLVLAAFLEGKKANERAARRSAYAGEVVRGEAEHHRDRLKEGRHTDPPLVPFHWEIEFPEVFERGNPGFDAVVGNPPFAGKNSLSAANVPRYPDWLKYEHEESHGNADLVSHFFRRAFNLLRQRGAFGLIATNTIAQGDTRASGLRWICKNGGEIFSVRRRVKWPGLAAVVVSVLHIGKGLVTERKEIDGRDVERITAFLFHRGDHNDPVRLVANAGKSFQGSIVLGMGFTFDDTDKKGVATSLAEMRRLIEINPRNKEIIFPYIGGEEVNTSPTHAPHRYVINFRDYPLCREDIDIGEVAVHADNPTPAESSTDFRKSWVSATDEQRRTWLQRGRVLHDYPEPVAADWPDLLAIVRQRAKPERDVQNRKALRERWWQYAEKRPGLYSAIAGLERVLVISRVGNAFAFCLKESGCVFSERLVVFPFSSNASFTALQSRVHETWARCFSSTLKDDLMYAPSDCFETFPFCENWETRPSLETAGKTYYEFRAALMVKNDEGLTKTYNRFHDPYDNDPAIARLRELHATMDRAVLDAYGWTDIPTDCKFLLDYDIDEEEWGNKKKPYRYRWPEDVREEVLARLLELNTERAKEEARAGSATESKRLGRKKSTPKRRDTEAKALFS